MAENETSLDVFLTPDNAEKAPQETSDVVNLEDEFAKLLNNFISQPAQPVQSQNNTKQDESKGLDSFVTPTTQAQTTVGLDSFISPAPQSSQGLDSFVTSNNAAPAGGLDSLVSSTETASDKKEEDVNGLKTEERELARAVSNFQDGVYALADKKSFKVPTTDYNEEMLKPNYKPSTGKKIAQYMLACWDIINKYDPENMKRLSKDASDEDYLAFAETLSDTDMQLSIISYVEILINLELCEVSYEQRKEIIQKNRIKRELYEEYMELQERKATFIRKLKEKNFPIDVDKLINNYFRTAQKDPDGSFEALTKNPAMFSPIEFDKIKPKFFGLIKVTPEDGIKANQKIGAFIKKLKV
ncbi:MAG: hypothetical protein NC177_16915 [Ruminococcus flavefaciens]|nr:hypothetical protein [Ruminococcus flavefaciens]